MAKALWYIFGGTIISGFFLAIYILTGTSIDPTDLLVDIGKQIAQSTTNSESISFWNTAAGIIIIAGIIETVASIISFLANGLKGIITASCGFFGVLCLILGLGNFVTYLGIGLLFFGGIICFLFEGEAPEDIFSSNLD